MKGGRRARSGPVALPAATHMLRGTHRPDRHGRLDGSRDQPAEWTPVDADLARLGVAGRTLVERIRRDYVLSPLDGVRVVQAGEVMDKIAALLALARTGFTPAEAATLDRSELGWRQLLARHLDSLEPRK